MAMPVNMILVMYVILCILSYDFNKLTMLYIHVHISSSMTNKSGLTFFLSIKYLSVCLSDTDVRLLVKTTAEWDKRFISLAPEQWTDTWTPIRHVASCERKEMDFVDNNNHLARHLYVKIVQMWTIYQKAINKQCNYNRRHIVTSIITVIMYLTYYISTCSYQRSFWMLFENRPCRWHS